MKEEYKRLYRRMIKYNDLLTAYSMMGFDEHFMGREELEVKKIIKRCLKIT